MRGLHFIARNSVDSVREAAESGVHTLTLLKLAAGASIHSFSGDGRLSCIFLLPLRGCKDGARRSLRTGERRKEGGETRGEGTACYFVFSRRDVISLPAMGTCWRSRRGVL